MPAHTPGPWRAMPSGAIQRDAAMPAGAAVVAYTRHADEAQQAANAALIAAAPALLAALRKVVACLNQPVQDSDMTGADMHRLTGAVGILRCDARIARETALRAIAQAEGRAA